MTGMEGVNNSLTCPDALLAMSAPDLSTGLHENNHVMRATVGLKGDYKGWTYDTAFVARIPG